MAEFSNYPDKIDTTTELPKATDNVTPVKAELFNRLRDAIIAVENELGVQPSSTYSTVKARLDALEKGLDIGAIVVPGTVTVKDNGTTVDNAATLNIVGLAATSVAPGEVKIENVSVTPVKMRVYRSSSLAGAAVTVFKTVTWNAISTLLTATNASQTSGNTQITVNIDGVYGIDGQLTIQPTAGVVGGITINILKNGSVVHTISDSGATWGIGIVRSFAFSLKTELLSSDTVSVEWLHNGNVGSTTQLNSGDSASWLSIVKLQ